MPEAADGPVFRELTGWGRTAPTVAELVSPTTDALPGILAGVGTRGVIARGLGRSYGDAALNAGGTVIAPLPSEQTLHQDVIGGPVVEATGGTSLHEMMAALIPTGHFVPVTPGTRYVTLGGAIAADVHGKNHHRVGSIGNHVVSLNLLTADGTIRSIGPDAEPDLFWATVGGMGLTGIITKATLRVPTIETGYMSVTTERLGDLDAVMARMREADAEATHSVAWIDTLARGRHLGRSVLTLGEHATLDELPVKWRGEPLSTPHPPRVGVPQHVPGGLMSRTAIRAFNEFWFRKAPVRRDDEIQSIAAFFHPLDMIGGWNRLYGTPGFVQYQFVLPDSAEDELPGILERIAEAGHPSFLSVLKRFGPGNPGLLSFPQQGWTLALDVPTRPGLRSLFTLLDQQIAEAGGRLYLAKDSRMSAVTFARMYPRLDEFRRVRASVDPDRVFQSDLSRRLRIDDNDQRGSA